MSPDLTDLDQDVRGALTCAIAELGFAPTAEALAPTLGLTADQVRCSLRRLHDAHALLLHPHRCEPWAVHPFALSPGSCWVRASKQGWWANCLYCGMGIAAAVGQDADIHTRIGGEQYPVVVQVKNGQVIDTDLIFHLSTPVREWWDNVIHACSSFQPFRDTSEIDDWCERHNLPRGAVVPLPVMWKFAADWYGSYLRKPWRKRTSEEAEALFEKHGLTGDFWRLS